MTKRATVDIGPIAEAGTLYKTRAVKEDLAAIGPRLRLPTGWTLSSRTLDQPLVVDTRSAPGQVLQDDLGNSYSKVAGA